MIVKNHTIELKDTSASEMARFRQIMLGIWSQQIEDDENTSKMNMFIEEWSKKKKKKKKTKKVIPIYKNIYIALDYDGTQVGDQNREIVEFTSMEKSGWKGIYASNIREANTQLINYLRGTIADNILLETHGGPERYLNKNGEVLSVGTYMSADNNNRSHIGEKDLSNSITGTNTKNQDDVNALVSIIKQIKPKGNFYLQSCNTADSDIFFNNLHTLTGNTVNLYGSNELTSTRFVLNKNKKGIANYTPANLFDRNTITTRGGKLYQADRKDEPPILLNNIKINKSGIVSF
ncbi:hypothetical protein [Flavobacterium tructae]|uniref:Uncharacterized protein n=1 Tax=Flavobacterium tructae TaxID=1114873 RepID=A0A1S1J5C7_9FLAO|nr:hypothetical protein [Flavobacterium tructae]OHT45000.1 hypothetical protein BHE19_09815 [Flavobacterium tructae]OXB16648.1 hypothetical protein B0A71_19485 [Flavobacterium tructae]